MFVKHYLVKKYKICKEKTKLQKQQSIKNEEYVASFLDSEAGDRNNCIISVHDQYNS